MKEIRLRSRYGVKNVLTPIPDKENEYLFTTDMPSIRLHEPVPGKVEWIDPAGGPMICVGELLDEVGAKVSSIKFIEGQGWIITFEV